ncbi:CHAT domain-containing protein [Parabacteroides sp. OttesenSCG-928-J18]|nr:CHAT domain-containing protein [Parabacteroides sp. OttesenSCG-928-J18]
MRINLLILSCFFSCLLCQEIKAQGEHKSSDEEAYIERLVTKSPLEYSSMEDYYADLMSTTVKAAMNPNYHSFYSRLAKLIQSNDKGISQFSKSNSDAELGTLLAIGYLYSIGSYTDDSFISYGDYLFNKFEECLNRFKLFPDDTSEWMVNCCAGGVYTASGNHRKSLEYIKRSTNIASKSFGKESQYYIVSIESLLLCYSNMEEDSKVKKLIKELVKLYIKDDPQKIASLEQLFNNISGICSKLSDEVLLALLEEYVKMGGAFTHNIYALSIQLACDNRGNLLDYIESQLVSKAPRFYDRNPNGITNSLILSISNGHGDDVFGFYAYGGRMLDINGNNQKKAIEYLNKAIQYAEEGVRRDLLYEYDSDKNQCVPRLCYIADAYSILGMHDKELETYKKLIQYIKEDIGNDSPEYIFYSLQYTARMVSIKNDFVNAILFLDDVMPSLINCSLRTQGYCCQFYMTYAKYSQAIGNHKQAKKSALKAKDYINTSLTSTPKQDEINLFLAELETESGNLEVAKELFERNVEYANDFKSKIDLGIAFHNRGENLKAIEILLEAEKISRQSAIKEEDLFDLYEAIAMCYGLSDIKTAEKYYNLASKYVFSASKIQKIQHEFNRAYLTTDPYQQFIILTNAKRIYDDSGILDYTLQVQFLRGLGFYYYQTFDYDKAIDYYNQSLNKLSLTGKNNRQRTSLLYYLLLSYRGKADYTKAYEISSELWGIYKNSEEKFTGSGSLFLCTHIEDCINCGRLADAKNLLSQYQRSFPNEYSRFLRAKFAIKNNEYDMAEALISDLVLKNSALFGHQAALELEKLYGIMRSTKIDNILTSNIRKLKTDIIEHLHFMTPNERRKISWECELKMNELIQYTSISQQSINTAFDFSLFSKGLLFYTSNEIDKILGNNKKAKSQKADLQDKKNSLNAAKASGDSISVASLNRLVDELERDLTTQFVSISSLKKSLNISSDDVLKGLGKSNVAIDFVRYIQNDTTLYGAFIFSSKLRDPLFISLFDESVLLDNVLNSDGSTNYNFYRDKKAKGKFYRIVWSKLESHLEGYESIYFSGDGMLNQLAIELIPDEDDIPFNQKYKIHRVFHLADIKGENTIGNEFIAIGVSDHNSPIGSQSIVDRGSWTDLTNVATEFNTIQSKFEPYGSKIHSQYILNDDAKEEYVKSLNNTNVSTLHFATHGFYKSNNNLIRAAENVNDFDHNIAERALRSNLSSLSGLILREGNISWKSASITNEEDDILTSEEIENLTFPELRLTVLSACETGLGYVDSEGVWGLQRAFRIAGTQSLICSLCKVDDYWTSQFMDVFYENASQGKTIYESFQTAQKFLYENTHTKRNGTKIWPSFILIE